MISVIGSRAGIRALLLLFACCLASACATTRRDGEEPFGLVPDVEFDAAADRPPTARTLYRLARVLEAGSKDVEAAYVLEGCIRRYPHFLPAYVELAGLHVRQRRFDAAIEALQSGLRIAPNDPILHNDTGMCWLLKSEYALAQAEFEAALRASPDDVRFRANAALAAAMLGSYDEALEMYKDFLPPDQAHYNLAVACEARGDEHRAAIEFAAAGTAR